jgi:hypothetical protein
MIFALPALLVSFLIFKSMLFGDMPPHSLLEWIIYPFLAALFSLAPLGVCAGFAAMVGTAFKTHPEESARYQLVSIRDKDGVVGQFFLGSGTIKGDQYYFYYKTNSDGSVTPGKVFAGQGVRVYEQDRQDAELVIFEWELNKPWAWLVALPVNNGGWSYKFYVPKGTVRTGFTM